jgi:hypothetical protein
VADAAASTALEGGGRDPRGGTLAGNRLPAPGSLALYSSGGQPWRVETVNDGSAVPTNLAGRRVRVPLPAWSSIPLQNTCAGLTET